MNLDAGEKWNTETRLIGLQFPIEFKLSVLVLSKMAQKMPKTSTLCSMSSPVIFLQIWDQGPVEFWQSVKMVLRNV